MSKFQGYKKYYQMIRESNPQLGLKAVFATIDMWYWVKKQYMYPNEYLLYRFYEKNTAEKKTYIRDWECMHTLPEQVNKGLDIDVFDNKKRFNEQFSGFLGRDYICVGENDYEQFMTFSLKYETVMVKPLSEMGGHGIQKIAVNRENCRDVFSEITKNGAVLVEECIQQHKAMDAINSGCVNTVRVVSMIDEQGEIHIPFAFLRTGRKGHCVDNFSSGGFASGVNVESGEVFSDGYDKKGKTVSKHPDSGLDFKGFRIPNWPEVLRTVRECCRIVPNARVIGWDICIRDDNRVCVIEGNHNSGAEGIQLTNGKGVRATYQKYLGKF